LDICPSSIPSTTHGREGGREGGKEEGIPKRKRAESLSMTSGQDRGKDINKKEIHNFSEFGDY
jgi:hypothetical protein